MINTNVFIKIRNSTAVTLSAAIAFFLVGYLVCSTNLFFHLLLKLFCVKMHYATISGNVYENFHQALWNFEIFDKREVQSCKPFLKITIFIEMFKFVDQ